MGFFRLPEAVPPTDVARIHAKIADEFHQAEGRLRRDHGGRIVRIDGIVERFRGLEQLLFGPKLCAALRSLLGPNVIVTLNRHNHATLNLPGHHQTRLHRDILQWSRGLLTAIIYLEESLPSNGCTYLVPGSHFFPFIGIPNNGGTWMDEHSIYCDFFEQALPCPAHAGDILLFDSLVFQQLVPIALTPHA